MANLKAQCHHYGHRGFLSNLVFRHPQKVGKPPARGHMIARDVLGDTAEISSTFRRPISLV